MAKKNQFTQQNIENVISITILQLYKSKIQIFYLIFQSVIIAAELLRKYRRKKINDFWYILPTLIFGIKIIQDALLELINLKNKYDDNLLIIIILLIIYVSRVISFFQQILEKNG